MTVYPRHLIGIIILIVLVHAAATHAGLYKNGALWVDFPLHVLGGSFLACGWLWVAQRPRLQNLLGKPSKVFLAASLVGFALAGGLLWELFEFGMWRYLPVSAGKLKIFPPTVSDVLSDFIADVIGGAIVAFIFLVRSKRSDQ